MREYELQYVVDLVRREQELLGVAKELVEEHWKSPGVHSEEKCRLCGLYYRASGVVCRVITWEARLHD